MHLEWTDELETGIAEIDAQNRRIVDFINTLETAKQEGDATSTTKDVLEQLLDYVVNQFLHEEDLMAQTGYEFRSTHERVHELFAKHVADLRGRSAAGEDVTNELLEMLLNWVEAHIKLEDKNYARAAKTVQLESPETTRVASVMKRLFG